MEAMGQNVRFCFAPGNEFPVEPNPTVAIIERNYGHLQYISLYLGPF